MAFDPKDLADNGRNSSGRPIRFRDKATEVEFCKTTPNLLDGHNTGGWLDLELPSGPSQPPPRNTIGTRGQERGE